MAGPLSGIKILDLTHVLAGPFCTYQLALMGAEVIKIEDPANPDCARGRGPDDELNAAGLGLTYQVQGGCKQSLALDLRTAAGADILRTLVQGADVLIENYTPGALAALGLGYPALSVINPALIYCSISGYGDTGPQAAQGAYDNVIQATSGTIGQCGGSKPGVSFIDYATGYAAAFAVSAALAGRSQAGQGHAGPAQGTHISVSMLEVAMQMMAPEAAAAQQPQPIVRDKEAGISSYATASGTLMLGAFRPQQYRKLAALLEAFDHPLPDLADIHDWPDVWAISARTKAALGDIFMTDSAETWVARLRAADLPAERVKTLREAAALPQLAARGYFQISPDGATSPAATTAPLLPATAFHMNGAAASLHKAPPALGEDTQAILAGLGLDTAQIERLFETGVVA